MYLFLDLYMFKNSAKKKSQVTCALSFCQIMEVDGPFVGSPFRKSQRCNFFVELQLNIL